MKYDPERTEAKPGRRNKLPKPVCPVHGFEMKVQKTEKGVRYWECSVLDCDQIIVKSNR